MSIDTEHERAEPVCRTAQLQDLTTSEKCARASWVSRGIGTFRVSQRLFRHSSARRSDLCHGNSETVIKKEERASITSYKAEAMSVEDMLNYKASDDEDFYALLGCDESATVEQITAEYKVRALQYHPDKNEGNKEAESKFQQLKYAKEILCDPEKRSNYDKWRQSGIAISYKQWVGMKEHVQQSMHWSTPKTKDRMLPDASGAGGSPGHVRGQPANVHRRASEGGANIHYGARRDLNWDSQASSDVVNKFRNYEI